MKSQKTDRQTHAHTHSHIHVSTHILYAQPPCMVWVLNVSQSCSCAKGFVPSWWSQSFRDEDSDLMTRLIPRWLLTVMAWLGGRENRILGSGWRKQAIGGMVLEDTSVLTTSCLLPRCHSSTMPFPFTVSLPCHSLEAMVQSELKDLKLWAKFNKSRTLS